MATKAEIEAAYKALKEEHTTLLDRIVTIAGKAAYEHELCHVLDETLAEIGITVPTVSYKVSTVTERVYSMPLTDAYRMGFEGDNEAEIRSAIEDALEWNADDLTEREVSARNGVTEVVKVS